MSVKVMGRAWDLDLPPGQMLVLQAMADHANHEGGDCKPGVELIAWKTGYDERTVRRTIQALIAAKILVVTTDRRQHKPTVYRIDLDAGTLKPARQTGQNVQSKPAESGQIARSQTGQNVRSEKSRPDISSTSDRTSTTPKGTTLSPRQERVNSPNGAQYNHHENHDSIGESSSSSESVGGEGEEIRAMLLNDYGVRSLKHIAQIAGLGVDAETLRTSIHNLQEGGYTIGQIVNRLIALPPAIGDPYPVPTNPQGANHAPVSRPMVARHTVEADLDKPL